MARHQSLASMRNEVHRFCGVIDRFGSFSRKGQTIHALCVRDLHLAASGQPLVPDHWWFHAREVWAQAGPRVDDTVLFTAKVQRTTKAWDDPQPHIHDHSGRARQQVVGFACAPRSVVVMRRPNGYSRQLMARENALAEREVHLCETSQHLDRLSSHYTSLLERHQNFERQLADSLRVQQQLQQRLAGAVALAFSTGGLGVMALMARFQSTAQPCRAELPTAQRSDSRLLNGDPSCSRLPGADSTGTTADASPTVSEWRQGRFGSLSPWAIASASVAGNGKRPQQPQALGLQESQPIPQQVAARLCA